MISRANTVNNFIRNKCVAFFYLRFNDRAVKEICMQNPIVKSPYDSVCV